MHITLIAVTLLSIAYIIAIFVNEWGRRREKLLNLHILTAGSGDIQIRILFCPDKLISLVLPVRETSLAQFSILVECVNFEVDFHLKVKISPQKDR